MRTWEDPGTGEPDQSHGGNHGDLRAEPGQGPWAAAAAGHSFPMPFGLAGGPWRPPSQAPLRSATKTNSWCGQPIIIVDMCQAKHSI